MARNTTKPYDDAVGYALLVFRRAICVSPTETMEIVDDRLWRVYWAAEALRVQSRFSPSPFPSLYKWRIWIVEGVFCKLRT